MDNAAGPYRFDVGVIALANTDAPVRDAALDYVRAGIAGGIDAEESSSRPVDLYAMPGVDGRLPVGAYRFETTASVVGDDAEPEVSAQWGVTILLESVDASRPAPW